MRETMDRRNYGDACFLDLQKAFDTIDHEILLNKLATYGFRGAINVLLRDYLTNRLQYVENNNSKSKLQLVSCGVPQGSVLGPLLFLLYLNDLGLLLKESKALLFADDTVIYSRSHKMNDNLIDEKPALLV